MSVSKIHIAGLLAMLALSHAAHAEVAAPSAQPVAAQPVAAQPVNAQPVNAQPVNAQPVNAQPVKSAQQESGTIFTLWPLIDYRTSPANGFSNLSLLGPFFKFQSEGDDRDTAFRPLFYRKDHLKDQAASTYFLYPVAFRENTPNSDTYEVLRLFQVSNFRKEEGQKQNGTTTLLPFYVSGESPKRGSYRAIIPFYGDIYDRFWRDEYHFVMFPLYGSTVNRGTTTRHYLYPIFSTTTGEKESGFEVFPLYGQSHKEGVYRKRFVLWPFYTSESSGLNTDNPTEKSFLFPLYARTDSPKKTVRTYLWPFFGYTEDRVKQFKEVDYFWPFVTTVRGEERNGNTFLPLYSHNVYPGGEKTWYLWPIFKHEEIRSNIFNQDQNRILYFLYRDTREQWPKDGSQRRRTAMWPLFLYSKTPEGVSSLSLPAPVESILDKEGIEEVWAPLWRVYQSRWDDNGNSATSVLWNLFWEEKRGQELAYELFPLVSYRRTKTERDLKLLKGLISLKKNGSASELNLFWLPFGLKWGGT